MTLNPEKIGMRLLAAAAVSKDKTIFYTYNHESSQDSKMVVGLFEVTGSDMTHAFRYLIDEDFIHLKKSYDGVRQYKITQRGWQKIKEEEEEL